MVNRASVIPTLLTEPLLHGVFHLGSVGIRMGTLSANNFEEMVLAIANIVFDTTAAWVCKVLLNSCESVCSLLKGLFYADYMQVDTVRRLFLFDRLLEDLFSHPEFVRLGIFWVLLRWANRDFLALVFSVLLHFTEQSFPISFTMHFRDLIRYY